MRNFENMNVQELIKSHAEALFEEIRSIREHLHRHPELSFEEKETSAFVSKKLTEWGISHQTNVGGYGIVALIEGRKTNGKVVALRADMDALPITEQNDAPYCSVNKGVMHACGHDVHTACVLGAAKILTDLKNEWKGTVKLIFQPGEEKFPGGASIMIREGVLNNPKVDVIFGQHVHPAMEVGKVGFRPGIMMASADEIHITVKGKGGHGAYPHNLVDPVLISAHLIVALQQIVSRNNTPGTPSVLSIGKVLALGATNIVPSEVKLEGTFRTFDEKWRAEAKQKIRQITESICKGLGGDCDIDVKDGYPFLNNDENTTENAHLAAKELVGDDKVVDMELLMASEDFSYYTHHAKACFYRLGVGNKSKGITSLVHTPTFDIDPEALKIGASMMAWLAVKELANV